MALTGNILRNLEKVRNFSSIRRNITGGKIIFNKQPSGGSPTISRDVPGLSQACVKVPSEPVGPGAAKNSNYKNPEYFCYDKNSYFEAEVEMLKFRCPQPDVKVYYKPSSS